jgi:uncharacterized protein (DUF305 family)
MKSHYKSLSVELLIDGVIMFFVMYAMVDTAQYIYLNINNLYMTHMMVAPMALVMLIAMRHMYQNKNLNLVLYALFIGVFIVSFYAIRTQALVGDAEFLRSMIPHHSGAILMCQEANLSDPEIVELCNGIIESQQREINQMEAILKRY